MTGMLVEPLTSSPLRSLLRHRFGSRVDRALVFFSPEGEVRVEHPQGTKECPYRRPGLAMVRRKVFDRACWVSLVEHATTVEVAERAPEGQVRSSLRRAVTWWVTDPVLVTRTCPSAEDIPSWVAYDMARREDAGHHSLSTGYGAGHMADAAPGTEFSVREIGIAYRINPRAPAPAPSSSGGPVVPASWGEEQNEAYRFYRDVVAQGPHGLAALWLLHHPDQAREALDWTVQHRDLLAEETAWEHSLTALLQGLSEADRGFVGVKVAELLSDLGIPQADEALDRVRHSQPPNSCRSTGESW